MVTVIQPDYSETSGSRARFNTRAFWFLRSHPWVPAMKLQISWCPNSTPTRCEPDELSRVTLTTLEHISKVSSLLCSYLKKPIYFSSENWEVFIKFYLNSKKGGTEDWYAVPHPIAGPVPPLTHPAGLTNSTQPVSRYFKLHRRTAGWLFQPWNLLWAKHARSWTLPNCIDTLLPDVRC